MTHAERAAFFVRQRHEEFMSNTLEDTQPRSPFEDHPVEAAREILPDENMEATGRGTGCGLMGLVSALVLLLSILIVGLAAAAGWTAGQREANSNATATQNASVAEQMAHIPTDIASGNTALLGARLNYVATIAPGAPGFAEFAQTGTALALQLQPTATFTPSPTIEATDEPEAEVTLEIVSTPSGDSPYDLASLLQEAQTAFDSMQYADAIELLEAISGVDPSFESSRVRQLLADAMNSYALQLYQSDSPALANTIVSRIEALGLPLREGLSYERQVAEQFLNAQSMAAAGNPNAVRLLQELINQGAAGRYYTPARDELYAYYIRSGDFYAGSPDYGYCPAAEQYRLATGIYSSGDASGKLSFAENMCSQATPTPDPLLGGTPATGQPMAPIGVPGS
jgi:hypothetical protein